MKSPFDLPPNEALEAVIGLGRHSFRKSYYPELRDRLCELERFRALFDAGNDLLFLVALPSQRIVDVNLPACERLGWPRDELLGQTVEALIQGGCPRADRIETMLTRCDGTIFPVELTFRVADAPPGQFGLIVARDITERRLMERDLREARDKAERASLAKSKFLAAASHDLRQPAQSLACFVYTLEERLAGHPEHQIVQYITASLDALQQLLNGLLDVSRLDAGIVHPTPTAFPLDALLMRLGTEYGPRAAIAGIDLRIVASSIVVHVDAVLLERMVRNLIENAIRYTPEGRVLVGCRKRGQHVRIDVIDTGIGIPECHIADIFEEFFQVGNAARDRSQGLGLGLAIVKRMADLLGLTVAVRSRVGKGSTFSIELPICEAPLGGTHASPAHPRSGDGEAPLTRR